jgi:hypothetical protein
VMLYERGKFPTKSKIVSVKSEIVFGEIRNSFGGVRNGSDGVWKCFRVARN